MGTPAERIAHARSLLIAAGLSPQDAAFDAELLARHALGWDRARLLAHGHEPSPAGFGAHYDALVARRVTREPVAQIIGSREFWGLEFEVTRDVLVPRPETEIIVEEAIAFAREQRCDSVIDVGTGSGCVAITIAHELPATRVLALDRSEAALAVARRNATRLGVAARTMFQQADVLDGVEAAADLIVSNPPYVPVADQRTVQPEVARWEPAEALFAGADGLDVIRRLLQQAPFRLEPDGRMILEFGFGQADAVQQAAQRAGWRIVRVRGDLQGIPRTMVLSRESISPKPTAS